jgi:hypothetical protein
MVDEKQGDVPMGDGDGGVEKKAGEHERPSVIVQQVRVFLSFAFRRFR